MTIKQLDAMLKVLDKRYKAFEDIEGKLIVQYQHEEGIEFLIFQANDSQVLINACDEKLLDPILPLTNMYFDNKFDSKKEKELEKIKVKQHDD